MVRAGFGINKRKMLAWGVFAALMWIPVVGVPIGRADQPLVAGTTSTGPAAERVDWKRSLRSDVHYLAGEELRGRSVTDETIDQAAEYIAERFAEAGLETDVFGDSPRQTLEVALAARAGAAEKNRVSFQIHSGGTPHDSSSDDSPVTITASLGDGMNPLAIGVNEAEVEAPVAFAGYGITAPKLGYDDYAGIDVEGKAVLVLRKEPGMADPDSPFDGTETTRHAYFATKVENAIRHGAVAVLLVNDPASVAEAVEQVEQRITKEKQRSHSITEQIDELPEEAVNSRQNLRKKLAGIEGILENYRSELDAARRGVLGVSEAGRQSAEATEIPVISLSRGLTDRLLMESTGRSLASLEAEIDRTDSPKSLRLPRTDASLRSQLKPTSVSTSNVVGVLPGRGNLDDQTVVIGAHYDHVGMGGFGSLAPGTVAVHNGADDNASGTATLLAAASRLTERLKDVASHRRIVFIAFTAEERGLLGSRHYVRHPRFPLEETVAMINLDMVGRLKDNELTVHGTGSAVGINRIVDQANAELGFDLYKIASGYGPSDHQPFYRAGVPVLFFFTGLHPDYHRPSDDFDKINFGGMARITDMVVKVAERLAVRDARLEYAVTEDQVRIRRQLTAYLGVRLSDKADHVVLSEVVADGPADRGGLRREDRLVQLGEQPVTTAEEVLDVMRRQAPGDTLVVRFVRDGQQFEAEVQLDKRP